MKRLEWFLVICGFILITINFSYALMRQRAAEQLLERYDLYAQARDARWEPILKHMETHMNTIEENAKRIEENEKKIEENEKRLRERR